MWRLVALTAVLSAVAGLVCAGAAAAEPLEVLHPRTIAVNTTADAAPDATECAGAPGDCSLRQAIDAASPGDTIQLQGSSAIPRVYTLSLGAPLTIAKPITIAGSGAAATIVDGSRNTSAGGATRVMAISGGELVQLRGLGITGGGISSSGWLALWQVAFTHNTAATGGGLFVSGGTVIGDGVTFTADGRDGLYVGAGTVGLVNSTFTANGSMAALGGGIENAGGTLTLVNDTLSENLGGSLETDRGATTSVENTILAAGAPGTEAPACVAAGVTSTDSGIASASPVTHDLGHNLDQSGDCGLDTSGDLTLVDPRLAPLANNGGMTETQALLAPSPAIGGADARACPKEDQRGVDRSAGRCDIGSVQAVMHGVPTATTDSAAAITSAGAILQGHIDLRGEAGAYFFQWGASASQLTSSTPLAAAGVVTGPTAVSQALAGLLPGRTYDFQIVAVNASGATSASNVSTFITLPGPPALTAPAATAITDTTATIGASIDPDGADTSYTISWGTSPDSLEHQTTPVDAGAAPGPRPVQQTISGLQPNTGYYYAINAANADGPGSARGRFTTAQLLTGMTGTPVTTPPLISGPGCPSSATIAWGDGTSSAGQVTCTSSSFTVTGSHAYAQPGHYLVTATDSLGDTGVVGVQVADAALTPAAAGGVGVPADLSPPTTVGRAIVGATIAARHGTWSGAPTGYRLLWFACDASGAHCASTGVTAGRFVVGRGNIGDTLRVRETAVNAAGAGTPALSAPTAVIEAVPLPLPVNGRTVNVGVVSGTVLIRLPGRRRFTRLRSGEQIPVRSLVNTVHGKVALIVRDPRGRVMSADFNGGQFRVLQPRRDLDTVLRLAGGSFAGCPVSHSVRAAEIARRRPRRRGRPRRLLWGSGRGTFQTIGGSASASVLGTIWLTEDYCSGTLVRVRRGVVSVRDFVHHRTVKVRAGHSYFA